MTPNLSTDPVPYARTNSMFDFMQFYRIAQVSVYVFILFANGCFTASGKDTTTNQPTVYIDISKTDVKPVAVELKRPVYPQSLKAAGIVEGYAVVDILLDTHGRPAEVTVVQATYPEFGSSALTAVRNWRFTPAEKNNVAVGCHMQIPIVFSNREEEPIDKRYVDDENQHMERYDQGENGVPGIDRKILARARQLFPDVSASMIEARIKNKKVVNPRLISGIVPFYPLPARVWRVDGNVWVAFIVDINGHVAGAKAITDADGSFLSGYLVDKDGRVAKSAGNDEGGSPFTAAALDAVRQWKFTPGTIDGAAAPILELVPVIFRLTR